MGWGGGIGLQCLPDPQSWYAVADSVPLLIRLFDIDKNVWTNFMYIEHCWC